METLSVQNLSFDGAVAYQKRRVKSQFHSINRFSHDFVFGKSFLLEPGYGETLNWILAGKVAEDDGKVEKDGLYYDKKAREGNIWLVRVSSIKTRRFFNQRTTVQDQVRYGLQRFGKQPLTSERDVMDVFVLTQERYQRPIRMLSAEAWRASCAIGFVNGRRIFCFPYISESTVSLYHNLWLKGMIDFLKNAGALVLIPTAVTDVSRNLCDEIVTFE